MKDAFGTQINTDDIVVYAVRRGSSMSLKKLKVTSVTELAVQGYDPEDAFTRSKTLKQFRTIVVVPQERKANDADVLDSMPEQEV